MVGALNDTRKIADSIAVAILRRPRINLMDDTTLPPLQIVHSRRPGMEAVALAQAHRPDLVILDLSVLVMNGLDAARGIKLFLVTYL